MKAIEECFDVLGKIMKGIAEQFGQSCEIVLHDYSKDYQHSIVAIENGHVTGRHVGDCGTNLGLEVLRGLSPINDEYGYLSTSEDGKILKSTSVYFHDDDGKPIGAMCINWDISELISSERAIHGLISATSDKPVNELHTNRINDVLDKMIHESVVHVGKPVVNMTKDDKIKGLKYLDQKGALLIKRAGDKISKAYCISKNTLYNYLEITKKS